MRALALAACLIAAPAGAEVMDTLARMQAAAAARADVTEAVIDEADRSLKITMANGTTVTMSPDNLDNALERLATDAEKTAEVAHFVAQLDSVRMEDGPKLTDATLPNLQLVVSTAALYANVETADYTLWRGAIAPGLAEYLVLDDPNSVAYLTTEDVIASGQTEAALRDHALESLRAIAPSRKVQPLSESFDLSKLVLDGFYDCSLMALPEIWEDLAEKGPVGVSCPERGTLFVFSAEDGEAVAALRGLITLLGERPYPVSTDLFVWDNGWRVLD